MNDANTYAVWSNDDDAYVVDHPTLGRFFGDTPGKAYDSYLDALRVWASHARKNSPKSQHEEEK